MKRSPFGRLFNLLTVLVLAMTLMVCLVAGVTFVNPQVFFNPLKPQDDLPALLPTVPTPAPTASPVKFTTLPPVWTATAASTASPTATNTGAPIATGSDASTATQTPFPTPLGPTVTPTPSELPSRTPTLKPPRATATQRSYPDLGTDTPPPPTDAPTGYP